MYTDDELNHWGEIYVANHVGRRSAGMTFERFIANPQGYLQALVFDMAMPLEDDEEHYPPLPEQRIVAARIAAVDSFALFAEQLEERLLHGLDARRQDNHLIEPLRHHARGAQRDMQRRVQ